MRTDQSAEGALEAIVFGAGEPWLAERTLRSLARRGIRGDVATTDTLADRVAEADAPVWLLRAGAWALAEPSPVLLGARGRSVVALGATADSARWRDVLVHTGGDLGRGPPRAWPRIDSVVALDPTSFGALVAEQGTVEEAAAAAAASRARVVRVPSLDVGFQQSLRVVLGVTTLHRGGAERIVLDLARALRTAGHDVLLAVLDRAARATFDEPPGTIHLHGGGLDRRQRIALLAATAAEWGADVVHVHLLDGDELASLAEHEVPVAVTVHNARPGWPAKLALAIGGAAPRPPALVIGCSREVTAELALTGCRSPIRTVWNGIPSSASGAPKAAAPPRDPSSPLLLAVANHRPQKRLERLPAVLAALRANGIQARLLIVGEPVRADAESGAVAAAVRAAAALHGVADAVVLAGLRADVASDYDAADVVVSASAFEGLSLVHLEALRAGLPLVTTKVAGVDELAKKHDGVRIVDVDAPPEAFADAIGDVLALDRASERASRLAPDFVTKAMADRHAELFARVATTRTARREGLVLVTNNFSTGGAQSSARRLLRTLGDHRIPVSAIVIEEQTSFPTPGRSSLEAAGVPVFVAPRAGLVDPLVTARAVAERVDRARPRAVLFWNVIPEHKVLIADLLLGVDVWDVSPGEMYFASFERYLRRPRVGSPYLTMGDYGRLLAGAVVKYGSEKERAREALGTRIEVVPNGVVVPREPTRRRREPGEPLVAGTLARISPDKKLEQLVEGVALATRRGAWPAGLSLAIAGAAERGFEGYASDLRARSEGLPIDWAGEQPSAEFLGRVDLFAMVSEPSGCPNASLEAMAAGLAVVATDAGGASEQVKDGETGLLVPRGDAAALGAAIAELAVDAERRVRMGDGGHARARAVFDVERMAADYARLCLQLELPEP